MSFPPSLGITSSFIIDSNSTLVFQEFPSLLPSLDKISSPFSRITKMNGYSRISRSKSVDLSDLSIPHHKPRSATKIANYDMIPEHEQGDGDDGEAFGVILSRKCPIHSAPSVQVVTAEHESSSPLQCVLKRSFSIKRSASVSAGYSRIHHQSDLTAEDDDGECGVGLTSQNMCVKKQSKFLKACRRLFGL